MLGLISGFVDAMGFLDLRGIFAAAMTGNTTQFGIAMALGHGAHALLAAAVISSFFIGALSGGFLRRLLPDPGLIWLVMAAILVTVQMLHVGQSIGRGAIASESLLLALAMGMQGHTSIAFGSISVQTIVITNDLTKVASTIADRLLYRLIPSRFEAPPSGPLMRPGMACLSYLGGATCAGLAVGWPVVFLYPVPLLIGLCLDLRLHGDP